jgi:hypothetical protein
VDAKAAEPDDDDGGGVDDDEGGGSLGAQAVKQAFEGDGGDSQDDAEDDADALVRAALPVYTHVPKPLSKRHQRLKAKFVKLEEAGLKWDDL